jgi:thiamine-monophosphate kinase
MSLSEFQIIQRYFDRHLCEREDVQLGIGDDAALVSLAAGEQLAIAVDALVAGRHFPEDTAAEAIGHKALAVNLSDMAAMGAEPAWLTLALALPQADEAFVEGFARGLFSLAGRYGVQLIGGDTVRGPLTVCVQIHGLVPQGQALRRAGAQPGDRIYVTGRLGDAGAGLLLRQGRLRCNDEPSRQWLIQRLEYPEPRVFAGLQLRGIASAAIDISDGLLADLGHILEASGVGARIDAARLPISEALLSCVPDAVQREQFALGAGDDYELCFTVPPAMEASLRERAATWACGITCIGTVESTAGLRLSGLVCGKPSLQHGFDHFAAGDTA